MAVGLTTSIAVKGSGGGSTDGTSTAIILGQSAWGPSDVPTLISSYSDFIKKFGGTYELQDLALDGYSDTWGYTTSDNPEQASYAIDQYFKMKGRNGSKVYFLRVPTRAVSFTKASRTFGDMEITAKHDGYEVNAIEVTIADSRRGIATEKTITISFAQSGMPDEVFDISNARTAQQASEKSYWVTFDFDDGDSLPSNTGPVKLGRDTLGTAETYAATESDFVGTASGTGSTGLQAFNSMDYGFADVIIPGQNGSTVRTAIATHGENYWRMGWLGTASGLNVDTVGAALSGNRVKSVAAFSPNLRVSDFTSQDDGTILIDPVGSLVGLQHRIDAQLGAPHGVPAGLDAVISSVLDVERFDNGLELYNEDDINTLDDLFINGIRNANGVIHAANFVTRSPDLRLNQIGVVRTLYYIAHKMQPVLKRYVGKPLTPIQLANIKSDGTFELMKLYNAGALTGTKPGREPQETDAFYLQCDESNNSPDEMSAGKVTVTGIVAITRSIRKIHFNLVSSNIGSVLSVA